MGMVAMTYKINPNSEVEIVDADIIAETVKSFASELYDVQAVDVKPLAFGLKFVQVHVVMSDKVGGLSDAFEEMMSAIHGVGEIEVLSMGLL
jgi:elongation factor 1-beta